MRKITLLALSVTPAQPAGYQVTACLYCQGDRSPSQLQEYGPMTHAEMETLVDALLDRWRPGWEETEFFRQPPLWELGDLSGN